MIEESIFPEYEVEYAGFWPRFWAMVIDTIILIAINMLLAKVVNNDTAEYILEVIVNWIYFAAQESGSAQATIGKMACRLKVTSLDSGRISFWQATIRDFAKIFSFITLLIGYLMMLWDKKSQTLHDKIAGTVVVVNLKYHS